MFRILIPIIPSSLRFLRSELGLRVAQLLGSASPDVRLRVRGIAVTDSVHFCGGGNRFLSWNRVRSCDYSLVTRVRVLLTFLPTSLHYLRIFGFVGVTWCDTPPPFLAYPHVFLTCGPLIGFFGFFGIRQGYSCVAIDRQDDYSADSSALPCAVRLCWRFFPEFSQFSR